jgi:hypothetical protein
MKRETTVSGDGEAPSPMFTAPVGLEYVPEASQSALQQALRFAACGMPETMLEYMDKHLPRVLREVDRLGLIAQAYETRANFLRESAWRWRLVKPSDPLFKHIEGRAEEENALAERATQSAEQYWSYVADLTAKEESSVGDTPYEPHLLERSDVDLTVPD